MVYPWKKYRIVDFTYRYRYQSINRSTYFFQSEFRDYRPHDMVFTTEATAKKWKDLYDEFGDSFTEDSSATDLRKSLELASGRKAPPDLRLELEQALVGYPYHLLRGKVLYFDPNLEEKSRELAGRRCELYGGVVSAGLSESVTHVVAEVEPPGDGAYRGEREARLARRGVSLFHVVSPDWLQESVAAGRLLDEANFEL